MMALRHLVIAASSLALAVIGANEIAVAHAHGSVDEPESQSSDGAQLPGVESMLAKAAKALEGFAQQAHDMQEKVARRQAASRAALNQQKFSYERQLVRQDHQSYAIVEANERLRSKALAKKKAAEEQRLEIQKTLQNNAHLRDLLVALEPKLGSASTFIADALNLTDDSDSEARDLETKQALTMEQFLAAPKVRLIDSATVSSLIQGRRARSKAVPGSKVEELPQVQKAAENMEALVKGLSKSLEDLGTAEETGQSKLREQFLTAYRRGEAKQQNLLREQRDLNATMTDLQALDRELTLANEHVQQTQASLADRLRALRGFMRGFANAGSSAMKAAKHVAEAASAPKQDKA